MNSKVLSNEEKVELGNSISLYYGAKDEETSNPIRITLRGKFKPINNQKDYKPNIKQVKEDSALHCNSLLQHLDWIDSHYIFTSDFTECGIKYGKSNKWKCQIYIKPKQKEDGTLENFRPRIIKLGEDITNVLSEYLEHNGFSIGE